MDGGSGEICPIGTPLNCLVDRNAISVWAFPSLQTTTAGNRFPLAMYAQVRLQV